MNRQRDGPPPRTRDEFITQLDEAVLEDNTDSDESDSEGDGEDSEGEDELMEQVAESQQQVCVCVCVCGAYNIYRCTFCI